MIELKGKHCKDCKIFIDDVESEALTLIYNLLDVPAFANVPIRIMPDVHAGKGIVIGFTAPITNQVNPSHVGCDIGCSVTTIIFDKPLEEKDYAIFEHRVRKEIPTGFDIHEKRQFEMKDFIKFVKSEFSRARSSWPEMISDFDISERGISKYLSKIGMEEGVFYKSLGTTGGGNHFLEYGEGIFNGHPICGFTSHTGSRNFGLKVFKYWDKKAKLIRVDKSEYAKALDELKDTIKDKTTLPEKIKELKTKYEIGNPSGYLLGEDLKGYLTDMVFAQAYAKFNHYIILSKVKKIMTGINNAKEIDYVQSTHNYVDFNDHIIRKGAIAAYEGQRVIVPFNMRDGIAIGRGKSNEDWNYSCSHGAGRKMSRSKAKNDLTVEEFEEQMKGIYSTCIGYGTLDESPMAYKDAATIMTHISDTIDIEFLLKPKINIKASDAVDE